MGCRSRKWEVRIEVGHDGRPEYVLCTNVLYALDAVITLLRKVYQLVNL